MRAGVDAGIHAVGSMDAMTADKLENGPIKDEQIASLLEINNKRLREWKACRSGYEWFINNFPEGGMFVDVYNALLWNRRYQDSEWLVNLVFSQLDTSTKVAQLVLITGANKGKIEQLVKDCVGKEGEVATTGDRANAATTGESANAATTGESANAATTGDLANAATTGNLANAATTGEQANAATTGESANAATTGYSANAATTGNRANATTTGEHAVSAALGIEGKAKAGIGGAIVLCYRKDDGELIHVRSSKVGENGVQPDVWYALSESGNFMEVEDWQ